MTIQHTHSAVMATIIVTGAESEFPVYMGCIGHHADEPWEVTQERWDGFARTMYEFGVEPTEDEPFFTVIDDGVVWDHYTLNEIRND